MNLSAPLKKLRNFFNDEEKDHAVTQTNNSSAANDDIQVVMQLTPNPSAFKFILNKDVKTGNAATYRGLEECDNNLACMLFEIPAVQHLYFFDNIITVTLNPSVPIEAVKESLISVIKNLMPTHNPEFQTKEEIKKVEHENLPEDVKRISEILDRTIRPGLRADGGDLEILSYIHPELTVRYQGACGTCPSSTMGTLQAVTQILRDEFDPEIEVIPV